LHHSIAKEHYNKNYGAALAIWDWIFGSLHHSEDTDNLTLGLGTKDDQKKHTLKELYQTPFIESFKFLKRYFLRVFLLKKINKNKSEIYYKKSPQ
jgi:sterol desaturase/sphingolipid hydroxylase (fatty acid hydroxylase superfamily)